MDKHDADNCKCHKYVMPAQQSLDEVDFDRGIWNAAIYNHKQKIDEFIKKGKAMERDNCGYTALHYAARNGNEEICQTLINEGKVDVNATTNGGATALHRAAMMGHLNIVKILLKANAKVDIKDDDGQTALHRAAVRGHLEVSKLLLEKQPNLKEIKDIKDKIPFEYLSENANDDLKILLKPILNQEKSVSATTK